MHALLQNGLSHGLPGIVAMLMNAAMLLERVTFEQAAPCERDEQSHCLRLWSVGRNSALDRERVHGGRSETGGTCDQATAFGKEN